MMKSQQWTRMLSRSFVVVLAFGAVAAMSVSNALAAWKPTRPIEFIIMAGKGGGADRIARLMQKIVTENK